MLQRPGYRTRIDHSETLRRGEQAYRRARLVRRPGRYQQLRHRITDPDLPPEFNFPRAFAHWLVFDIPPPRARACRKALAARAAMPVGARELNSDFVTFKIPGFGRGYGGPWPPDRQHRYVFTLYALKVEHLDIGDDADFRGIRRRRGAGDHRFASFVAHLRPRKEAPANVIGDCRMREQSWRRE